MGDMKQTLPPGVLIGNERAGDIEGIRNVNQLAFKGEYEADVIDRLRMNCPEMLSLVAKKGDDVLGHILLSPVCIVQKDASTVAGMGLGPLAVLPAYQRLGFGSALCREGLQRMQAAGYPFVIVLGHPTYYPRFGFVRASTQGITSTYEGVPDDAFMIRIFDEALMAGVAGIAYYRPEFDQAN